MSLRNAFFSLLLFCGSSLFCPLNAQRVVCDDTCRLSGDRGDIRDDVFYGTVDEINAYFTEMKWSDGLPVVPPTFEKVSAFLKYTDLRWDETVAVLPIAHRNTTVWHVAVNGVMAGCKPEYMPILIAMTRGLGEPAFRRTLSSTHAWIPFSWLNGPVARQRLCDHPHRFAEELGRPDEGAGL